MRESKLRRLLELVEESGVGELEIGEFWGWRKVKIVKHREGGAQGAAAGPVAREFHSPEARDGSEDAAGDHPAVEEAEDLQVIPSPMVGTFYRTSTPGADPYVKEGDRISRGQVVCIIEAMKIMNEIESDVEGQLVRVMAEDAHPVEYNQPLFLVKRS